MQTIPETTAKVVTETERVMREFSELLPHVLWMADASGAVYFCNRLGLKYFGIMLEEMLGWDWSKLIHADDLDNVYAAWSHARETCTRYTVHYRLRRHDGIYRWFLCSAEAHTDAAGNVLRWVGTSVDIEDDKAAEQKAMLAEREMTLALNTAPLIIMRCNQQGVYTVIAGEGLNILGLSRESMLGRNSFELVENYPDVHGMIRSGLEGASKQGEIAFRNRWLDVRVQPIRAPNGGLDGATIAVLDITERRENERLVQSEKAAHEAADLKTQFLANMSHEVRTPMGGVLGMTDLLLDTPLTDEQRRYAEMIRASGRGLLAVLNDILDFSKLDAGKVQIEAAPFKLANFVENQAELMSPKAHEKNLTLLTSIDPLLPEWFVGDSVRIGQILLNLLSNALKFTERGHVLVKVEPVAPLALNSREMLSILGVRFSVKDSGIGMDAETQTRLFEPFMQADASTARRFGGTGLGLSICHRLAELMGGSIAVESEAGQGTTFSCVVPLVLAKDKAQQPSPDLSMLRCLVVDDDRVATDILSRYLSAAEAQVDCVRTGSQALEAIHKRAWGEAPYTTIFCEKRLADMDAPAFLTKVRGLNLAVHTDIVLIDSHSSRSAAQAAGLEGFAAYLTKPLRRERLVRCLVSLSGDDPTHAEAQATMAPPNPLAVPKPGPVPERKMPAPSVSTASEDGHADALHMTGRILVAEDNQVNQLIICAQLKKLGHRVTTVVNGQEAVEALNSASFDLVFMDCQMPVLDGYQATRKIRSMLGQDQAHLPIIALTANAMREDKERCLAAGMDDYVSKPFTPQILSDVVRQWMHPKLDV